MKALGRIALAAALAALLAPSSAQARFGKRGSGSASGGSSSQGSGSRPAPSGPPSTARPPHTGWDGRHSPYYRYRGPVYYGGWTSPYSYYPYSYYWDGGYSYDPYLRYPYSYGAVPPPPVGTPPAPPDAPPPPPAPEEPPALRPPSLTAGVDGLVPVSGGSALGVSLGLEGRRWGFRAAAMGFSLPSDTVAGERDTLRTLDAHLTYAFVRTQRTRVRVELGVNSVFAQDVVVLGPDGGVSAAVSLVGPLGAEASAHFTPLPHRRFDANAGLALALGPLTLRGGWRYLVLDDNGVLQDGSRNVDRFTGPSLGLALAL